MRIINLHKEERKHFASVLPEDIVGSDSLVLVSVDDEKENAPAAGVMVFSAAAAGLWSLDYLFTAESYRRRHVATELITYGGFLLQMMGASHISAMLLEDGDSPEDAALKQCLIRSGFAPSSGRTVSAVSVDAVCDRIGPYQEYADLKKIRPLAEIPSGMWMEIVASLSEMFQAEDIIVPLHPVKYYNAGLSMVMLDDAGLCRGLILISDIEEDLSVDYVWSAGRGGMVTMSLLVAALQRVKQECDILFDAHTKLGLRLAEKLLGSDMRPRYRVTEMVSELA